MNIFKRSTLYAFLLCLCGTAFNVMTYLMYGFLMFAVKLSGGRTGRRGFGLMLQQMEAGSATLSFDPISFLIPFLILFVSILLIIWRKDTIIKKALKEAEQ